MSLDQEIRKTTLEGISSLYGANLKEDDILIQETRKEFEGDRTIVIFPITRYSKKSPEETAKEIGDFVYNKLDIIEKFEIVKGFLNLTIKHKFWINFLNEIKDQGDIQFEVTKTPKRIVLEYSSPNTNKPLHLGHIRNNLLGYALAEILKARGHKVFKVNLINDRGIHICKSMIAWLEFGNGETPESAKMKGDHFVGKYYVLFDKEFKKEVQTLVHQGTKIEDAKKNAPIMKRAQDLLVRWEAGDKEVLDVWNKMNNWVYEGFEQTYSRMGVDFDKYYHESETYLLGKSIVNEGLERGIFYRKDDGSIWVDLTDEGLDEKLLLRSDGTAVYITQDLGTAQKKYEDYKYNESIYVVGNEQDYHFKVLHLILKKLKKPYSNIHHLSYGMVDLPTGKMKSREGTVVDADDLMDEMVQTAENYSNESNKLQDFDVTERKELFSKIGLAALKFFILRTDPKKRMLFNPKESIDFQGHTGPFVQYTYARISSVLKKAHNDKILCNDFSSLNSLENVERELIKKLFFLNSALIESEGGESPAIITSYIYSLAKLYNQFYHELPILRESDQQILSLRVTLSEITGWVIKKMSSLLGLDMPERM